MTDVIAFEVTATHKKISDDVLDSMKSLFKEAKVDIPESVIDRARRIGSRYLDAFSSNYC